MKLNTRIIMRVSSEEKKVYQEVARRRGISLSNFMREVALTASHFPHKRQTTNSSSSYSEFIADIGDQITESLRSVPPGQTL